MAVSYKNQVWTVNSGETYKDIFDDVKQIKNLADDEGYTIDCIIEDVGPRPFQKPQLLWRQCENHTAYQVIMTCLGISHKMIPAKDWQLHFSGVPKSKGTKEMSAADKRKANAKAYGERKKFFREKMQQLHPSIKITAENADALAILSVFDKL